MPLTPTENVFEYQGGGEVIPLFLEGEYKADGTVMPLTISLIPKVDKPTLPLSPSIVAYQMDTQTSATISWVAANNIGRPPITGYKIYRRDNGGSPVLVGTVSASTFTFQNTGMPTSTPNITFGFTVRATNADGEGADSNRVLVQWGGTPTPQPPVAPFALSFASVTQTGVTLNWSQALDTSVTKNAIYQNGVLLRDNISPTAISFNLTGLTPNTTYDNITIRRFNAEGWSPDSNPVTFTTLTSGGGGGIVQDPVMGQSTPSDESAYLTQLDATRIYNWSDAVSEFNTFSPRVIAITDNSSGLTNGATIVNDVENMLETFYYGSGASARQNCEMHVAIGNEVDRDYATGSLPAGFIDAYMQLRQLIWTTTGGVRRYPKASLWVDMTANNVRNNGSAARFKPIARYLDGMAASFYPAGRTISGSNPDIEYDPAGYPAGSIWAGLPRNAYDYYAGPLLDCLDDWRATGSASGGSLVGQLDSIACWEIGIPIHHSLSGMDLSSAVRSGTLAAGGSDVTQRRAYLVGGARTSGVASQQYNFKGFLQYMYDECVARNFAMREMIYWNQQSNAAIPNKWEYDVGLTSPDSVHAWNAWTPGSRLPNI